MRRPGWLSTKYPGVKRHPRYPGQYQIVGQPKNRLGKRQRFEIIVRAESAQQADKIRADRIVEIAGSNLRGARQRPTVTEYARSWLKVQLDLPERRRSTGKEYASAMDNHILPILGDALIDELNRSDVQRAFNMLRGKPRLDRDGAEVKDADGKLEFYAANTVRFAYSVFNKMMRDAFKDDIIQRIPCFEIVLPAREHKTAQDRTPQIDELALILDDFRRNEAPRFYALLLLKAMTGLRFAHASSLKWADIRWSADEDSGGTIFPVRSREGALMTSIAPNKPVPEHGVSMQPELQRELRAYQKHCIMEQSPAFAAGWMFPQSMRPGPRKKAGRGDGPMRYDEWQRAWDRARKRLSRIGAYTIPRGVGAHSMRRSVVDILGKGGVDPGVAQQITGHSSIRQLMGYRTVRPADVDDAARVVALAISDARERFKNGK